MPYRRHLRVMTIVVALVTITLGSPPWAQTAGDQTATAQSATDQSGRTGLPLPRFVSLRAGEVNLRAGPGIRYPIDWVYKRKGLPVEVIDEFETWRRIRDHDGTMGWVHQSMLEGSRRVLVMPVSQYLLRAPDSKARAIAELEPGVVANLVGCDGPWCQVRVEGYAGWLKRAGVFGLYPDEKLR